MAVCGFVLYIRKGKGQRATQESKYLKCSLKKKKTKLFIEHMFPKGHISKYTCLKNYSYWQ